MFSVNITQEHLTLSETSTLKPLLTSALNTAACSSSFFHFDTRLTINPTFGAHVDKKTNVTSLSKMSDCTKKPKGTGPTPKAEATAQTQLIDGVARFGCPLVLLVHKRSDSLKTVRLERLLRPLSQMRGM